MSINCKNVYVQNVPQEIENVFPFEAPDIIQESKFNYCGNSLLRINHIYGVYKNVSRANGSCLLNDVRM